MTEILPEVPAGDSGVQRAVETAAVELLAVRLGVPLMPARMVLTDGGRVEIDAVNLDARVIAEVWAHQGPPKSAQRNKVLADALKLVYVEADQGGRWRKILCFTDEQARDAYTRRSWYAGALRRYGIEEAVTSSFKGSPRLRRGTSKRSNTTTSTQATPCRYSRARASATSTTPPAGRSPSRHTKPYADTATRYHAHRHDRILRLLDHPPSRTITN